MKILKSISMRNWKCSFWKKYIYSSSWIVHIGQVFNSKMNKLEIIDCMLQVAQENIRKEILEAEFVADMADETTDVANCYQMTTVFRYILPNGRSVECFWNFVTPSDHDAVSLSECVKTNSIKVLDKPEKLIAQSYDGASVMSGRHGGVQALIQRDYIYAYFIHVMPTS
ncbi:unnamed protein product [Acanthoscelides obtectus]|uniref:DUF4371 domain-containing protein n=1 Tax=Acanthoscelides obtectus TaxID=200917 RepID=A0A9P0KIV2_ACAOB|nr:unnamed protein product [Acanthoscelides obtectus]CAK1623732.1 hypothetical protein AOBTE_LOCUS2142 [Acanthoscelides obtectus]